MESPGAGGQARGVVIGENLLETLLMTSHTDEADRPVPKGISDLLLHVVETHVDQVQDIVTRMELDLDAVELELDRGEIDSSVKFWIFCIVD